MSLGDDFAFDIDDLVVDTDLDGVPDFADPFDDRFADLSPSEVPGAGDFLTDPAATTTGLEPGYFGEDVADAAEHWHMQESSHSCAVAAQEFVLDDITGVDHSEAELAALAEQNGWYTPGQGTAPEDIGNILRAYGIPTEQQWDASVEDLASALDSGEHVIVGVDSGEILAPHLEPDMSLDNVPGIPGSGADHAIQVIGIDNTDPANPMVIVNDPGVPDGMGAAMPLEVFLGAWQDSGNMMVTAAA